MSGQPVEAAKKAAQDVKDKVEPGKSQVWQQQFGMHIT